MAEQPRQCPACRSAGVRAAFGKDGYTVLRCPHCGLRFCADQLDMRDLAPLYDEPYFTGGGPGYEDYVGQERTHRRQARRYLGYLHSLGIAPGRLLDVGCAAGFFLDEARRAGWTVQGCDVSPYATELARDRLHLDVQCAGFLEADLPNGAFDVVTAFNVFEHLPDPRAAVDRLARLVRPGGYVVLETWNADSLVARLFGAAWHQYSLPYVPFYYTPDALARLFRVERWRFARLGWWAKWISLERAAAVLAYNAPTPAIGRLARRFGHSRLGALEVPYVMGDLVIAAIQRRVERRHAALPRELRSPVPVARERRRRPSGTQPPINA